MKLNNMELLTIDLDQLEMVSSLPLHHRDRFDRLLISQALFENMPIPSIDVAFDAYPVR